jgi:hypothetical protein
MPFTVSAPGTAPWSHGRVQLRVSPGDAPGEYAARWLRKSTLFHSIKHLRIEESSMMEQIREGNTGLENTSRTFDLRTRPTSNK